MNTTIPTEEHRDFVYRWDLDKTYLRTEFDTLRDLVRIAIEPPRRKRTVPGAPVLLRELRATSPGGIHILSGSPEQMRRAIEAKLRIDGIQWDSLTLKPTLHHLLRGRFRFVREQLAYKLTALLSLEHPGHVNRTQEWLFGDDAEADAYVYSLYADISAGRVDTNTLLAILERARIREADIHPILTLSKRLMPRTVRRVFIHLDRISAPDVFEDFGPRLCPFFNYFQPALVLLQDQAIGPEAALHIGATLVTLEGFHPDALVASFKDLHRRHVITTPLAHTLLACPLPPHRDPKAALALQTLMRFLEPLALCENSANTNTASSVRAKEIDYITLFDRDRDRTRESKKRAQWRR